MTLHELLDRHYGEDGEAVLLTRLRDGANPNERDGDAGETPLHVAARRRRCAAIRILLEHGADIDVKTKGGKTAFAHAARRGFDDVVAILESWNADPTLTTADRFAIAVLGGRLDDARALLAGEHDLARSPNPEEGRLLADAAGRHAPEAVAFLLAAGADPLATGLDSGTPLHQAAWFGQPENVRLLLAAGAPLEVFDPTHGSSPLGWAVHGSRYSGAAEGRQDAYVEIVRLLLDAGALARYPDESGKSHKGRYLKRLRTQASPRVRELLPTSLEGP